MTAAVTTPRSRADLLARARQQARLTRGRTAFVREARLAPIGAPLALLAAAAVVATEAGRGRRRWPVGRPSQRDATLRATGLGLLAAGGALAVTWAAARAEWALRQRAWERES